MIHFCNTMMPNTATKGLTSAASQASQEHCRRICTWLLVTCCALYIASKSAYALTCFSNELQDVDNCSTTEHIDSKCYKSVERIIVNNTYATESRYGCLTGSDESIAHLQCHMNRLNHTTPRHIGCCSTDFCNLDLPDPKVEDDERWGETAPPPRTPNNEEKTTTDLNLWPLAILTVLLTVLCTSIFCVAYKLAIVMFRNYWTKHKTSKANCSIDGHDSVYSYKVSIEERFAKNQFANLHHNPASSSASTHSYTESECLSQKPGSPHDYESSLASREIEHTSTLPDMTSGRGTRILMERTMARVVDSGATVPVGSGRFGRVFKGTYHGEDFAIKAFQAIDDDSWSREEKILRMLNHENIVRYIASEQYSADNRIHETWMFLEYCPYGSLCDFLDSNEVCGPQQAVKIVLSIIRGLSYLHEDYSRGIKPPIAHRDIKSRNILMRTPETCCIADFGHAVVQCEHDLDFGGYKRFQVGTIRYMAPEILCPGERFDQTQFYTFAQADIYQFGLVLWEVCHRTTLDISRPGKTHMLPYDGVVPQNPTIEDMIKIVCEDNYRPERLAEWDRHSVMKILSSLMVECWRPNPKARMETLGVKKRIKDLHEQLIPQQTMFYQHNLLDSFSLIPNCIKDKGGPRTTDHTY